MVDESEVSCCAGPRTDRQRDQGQDEVGAQELVEGFKGQSQSQSQSQSQYKVGGSRGNDDYVSFHEGS